MDSMRSLNTSLPQSSPRHSRIRPQGELLSAFKAAALSVTQLYKTAAAEEDDARAAGYQDAIDELLNFLDQEDIGLGDGEGWRIRQWATERLSPSVYGTNEENEQPADGNTEQGAQDKNSSEVRQQSPTKSDRQEHDAQEQVSDIAAQNQLQTETRQGVFHFRASSLPVSTIPKDTDMDITPHDQQAPPAIRVGVLPRHANRPALARLHGSREPGQMSRSLGRGAGVKRKPSFPDFFDLSGLMNFDQSSKGGAAKRGRHV